MSNNYKIRNNILVKDNSNKHYCFNIPVIFKKYKGVNLIKIFVEKDIDDVLLKNHFYTTESNLLRIVPEFVYNFFLTKKISEINEDCFLDNSDYSDDENIDNYMGEFDENKKNDNNDINELISSNNDDKIYDDIIIYLLEKSKKNKILKVFLV